MTDAPMDGVAAELYDLADQYAAKAEALADDPYFREAVIKVAVSHFSWAMYHTFQGVSDRWALDLELRNQAEAVGRSVLSGEGVPPAIDGLRSRQSIMSRSRCLLIERPTRGPFTAPSSGYRNEPSQLN